MKRTAVALALVLSFASAALLAQPAKQPAKPPAKDKGKSAQQAPGQGIPKLSRRERKNRIAKLSEKFQEFLIDVEPIMLPTELDTFLTLETDPQRDVFVEDFWRRRDLAQGTSNRAFRDLYYARLEEVKVTLAPVSSDRAKMYLLHGPPEAVMQGECSRLLQPIQVWYYGYLPGFGTRVRMLFYIPRHGRDYLLWIPMTGPSALADLISEEQSAVTSGTEGQSINSVFGDPHRLMMECKNGDEILRGIQQMQQNRMDLPKVYDPPPANQEDVGKVLRSVVLSNPDAPKLTADFTVRFPAKSGTRTDTEITVVLPRAQIKVKELEGVKLYSIDVVGEMLRDNQLWEKFRYRFDFPGDIQDENLPIIIDRLLRPQDYRARIKVVDVTSGAEVIIEKDLSVPELFDSPEQVAEKKAATTAIEQLQQAVVTREPRLRLVPPPDEVVSGLQRIDTVITGDAIKAVEFWLDGRKVAVRRSPPYSLELDFGNVPQLRRVRAIGLSEKGEPITGDDILLNTGTDPFRIRIVSPRIAPNLRGRARVEIDVLVPEGKELGSVELYWNETRVATMFDPPFVQTVLIPEANGGIGYLRAVARLKDESVQPVEDVVMINSPAFMEELNIHLIELPTTVIANGKPVNNLTISSFTVLDEGKPVKVEKFEQVRNLPLSIGMAVDASGSMMPKLEEAQKAGAQFFEKVMKKGDKAFLVAFDSEAQVVQKWSPKVADVHAGLAKLRAEDYTSLYDAIVFSLYNFHGVKGQRALVVLTDGKDTSSKFTYEQALEYSQRAAVPIYAIGIGIRNSEVDVKYKLNKIAAETGGGTYYIDKAEDLSRIYAEIEEELRAQYVLGFYPPADAKNGKWREVKVETSAGKVKTIRGYFP
ncbi:MAG: VWA domain-containing protein [Thermoanaerobaculia bacterium]